MSNKQPYIFVNNPNARNYVPQPVIYIQQPAYSIIRPTVIQAPVIPRIQTPTIAPGTVFTVNTPYGYAAAASMNNIAIQTPYKTISVNIPQYAAPYTTSVYTTTTTTTAAAAYPPAPYSTGSPLPPTRPYPQTMVQQPRVPQQKEQEASNSSFDNIDAPPKYDDVFKQNNSKQ